MRVAGVVAFTVKIIITASKIIKFGNKGFGGTLLNESRLVQEATKALKVREIGSCFIIISRPTNN